MKFKSNIYVATVYQVLIPLLLLWLQRFAFYAYNADVVGELTGGELMSVCLRGTVFDIVAIAYINSLFVLMRFLPFDFVMRRWWQRLTMVIYGITNSLILMVNMGDIAFFRFNNGHMQLDSFLSMFDPEMIATMFIYIGAYWWAYVGIVCIIALMLWLATRVQITGMVKGVWRRVGLLVVAIIVVFAGMRGCRLTGRAIGIEAAGAMAKQPQEINVLLNTPFCILRSSNYSKGMQTKVYYSDEELASLRSSLHNTETTDTLAPLQQAVKGKNLMLIVLEGGGQIWFDSISVVSNGQYAGTMPFLNSIACKSLALTASHCTGGRTVEGLASIIGGVPTFGHQNWMATKYAALKVDAPARLLSDAGYETIFYIGAKGEAFSLGPLARAMGFGQIHDRFSIDYPEEGNLNGWGYGDHAMGRYIAENLSTQKQPFFATWLTIDLHSPFHVPAGWTDPDYPEVESKMLRCAQYTDYALRGFFETASMQPWFDNTVFIITSDHGFRDFPEPELNGDFVYSHVPFLIYTPDGSIPAEKRGDRAMAQFDIPPTLLWLAGYDKPYVGVGTNYFDDSKPHYGLTQRWGGWSIFSPRYMVRLPISGDRIEAVYDVENDPQLTASLAEYDKAEVDSMYTWFKAFMQDYTSRANSGRLTIANEPR